jgi:hypothetical protein
MIENSLEFGHPRDTDNPSIAARPLFIKKIGLEDATVAAYLAFTKLLTDTRSAFGRSETAIGATETDRKRYVDFKQDQADAVPPAVASLHRILDCIAFDNLDMIAAAFMPAHPGRWSGLIGRRAGTVLRLSAYAAGDTGLVNHPHTDVALFTVLPPASSPGLEVLLDGEWSQARFVGDTAAVLAGDMGSHFGGLQAVPHRVVSDGRVRLSASLFVNAAGDAVTDEGWVAGQMLANRLYQVQGRGQP